MLPEIVLAQRSGVPYYRQVKDQIAEAIHAGRLPGGTKLPSVRQLAAALLVSAITIRRAYSELELAGLISRVQGRGTFVRSRASQRPEPEDHARGRATLVAAVDAARRLGLTRDDVRAVVDSHLTRTRSLEEP